MKRLFALWKDVGVGDHVRNHCPKLLDLRREQLADYFALEKRHYLLSHERLLRITPYLFVWICMAIHDL